MEPTPRLSGRLGVSESGRHFVSEGGKPLFWLGDTQWELFRSYSLSDAKSILTNRKEKGFTAIQVMLVGVDPEENIEGELPWHAGDPLRTNEAYFVHVDRVLEINRELGGPLLVIGVFHACRMQGVFNEANARRWAAWVADRYGSDPNIVWSMYPRAQAEDLAICRALAEGLRAGDERDRLISVHPDPSPASSGPLFHDEEWLAFNSIQTFKRVELIRPMIQEDYARRPAKPVVMAEGAYEGGPEYGFDVTALWIRRQAYYSYLAGGHHSYGHNDSWRMLPSWREALDAPGAVQMSVLRSVLEGLEEWWKMAPDEAVLVRDVRTDGQILDLAARHPEDKWVLIYAAAPTTLSIDGKALRQADGMNATWIDPRSGKRTPAGGLSATGPTVLVTPEGFEDALLAIGPKNVEPSSPHSGSS